jgi:hypothetical protein
MNISKQIKYWYKKYLPEFLKKYISKIKFYFKNVFIVFKILSFQFDMKYMNPLSDLSWMSSNSNNIKKEFLEKVLDIINYASKLELSKDSNYKPSPSRQYEFEYLNSNNFPGEHYKLLVSIINKENLGIFTELGTGSGIACKYVLSETTATINTFDIVQWSSENSHLSQSEYENTRLNYFIKNVGNRKTFLEHKNIFLNSDLILLDASKDGDFENSFLAYLSELKFSSKKRYLLIDDIRYFSMHRVWNNILSEKIDITSFGHWAGTGIVDISNGLIYKKDL